MERKTEEQRISDRHNWFYAKINKTKVKGRPMLVKLEVQIKPLWLIQVDFTLKSYMPWEVGGKKDKRELNGQSDIIILKEKI